MNSFRISRIGHHIYVDKGLEALETYRKAFRLELEYKPWLDDLGRLIHGELQLNGTHFLSISDCKYRDPIMKKLDAAITQPIMMFTLYFSELQELQHAYDLLAIDAHATTGLRDDDHSLMSCDIIDRFGVCWHLCVPDDLNAYFIPK